MSFGHILQEDIPGEICKCIYDHLISARIPININEYQ